MAEKDYIGHRKRLRERYVNNGYEALQDYEIIELLLTFVKQRVDTKPLAKNLIKKYGTIEEILKADLDDLKKINGIGDITGIFLNFIGDIMAYSFKDKFQKQNISFKNKNQLISYLRNDIGFSKNEEFKVLFLNSVNEIIEIEILFTGTIDKSAIYPRKILERALHYNARAIVFAHNHPSGNIFPSEKDIELTKEMKEFFKIVDINVLDHIIITKNSHFSFLEEGII